MERMDDKKAAVKAKRCASSERVKKISRLGWKIGSPLPAGKTSRILRRKSFVSTRETNKW